MSEENPYMTADFWFNPTTSKRDAWGVYFIKLADLVSTRSTCSRKHCGAVIVKDNKVISTGYNGSNPGDPHCDDVGHFMVGGNCRRTLHAEINAINQAKERLSSLEGCKIFINTYPCWLCFGTILKEGIREIFYKDLYRKDDMIEKVAELFKVTLTQIELGKNHV
jgi:dCMP deaminase